MMPSPDTPAIRKGLLARLSAVAFVMASALGLAAPAAASSVYLQPTGQIQVIEPHGYNSCKLVTNSGSLTVFVPFRTTSEWDSFVGAASASAIPGVTIGNCCDASYESYTDVSACPAGQIGSISTVWRRDTNLLRVCGVHGAWTTESTTNSCAPAPDDDPVIIGDPPEPPPPGDCSLPWGGTLSHGSSVTAYASSSVTMPATCQSETRTCNNGTLSGSYLHQTCTPCDPTAPGSPCSVPPDPPENCTTPWGSTVLHGNSVQAFATATVPYGTTCNSQVRTCNDGTLSGSFANASCTVDPAANCTTPWGTTVLHGNVVQAFQNATVAYGASCIGENRSCNNGTLSGSFSNQNCTVGPPPNCTTEWGATVTHGSSVTGWQSASVPFGSTCQSQTRTCSAGTLSGSYTHQNCSIGDPVDCLALIGGSAIPHGTTVTAWNDSCQSTSRTCTNGSLSGPGSYDKASSPSCGPAPTNGACGSANGQTFSDLDSGNAGLCSAGTLSGFGGSGPWSWNCVGTGGGTTASCSATRSQKTVQCVDYTVDILNGGSSTASFRFTDTSTCTLAYGAGGGAPSVNTCGSSGLTEAQLNAAIPGAPPCTVNSAVNGTCGAANGQSHNDLPAGSPSLCSTGTDTNFSGSGPWTWTCQGSGGGTNASCSATKTASRSVTEQCTFTSSNSAIGNPEITQCRLSTGATCTLVYGDGTCTDGGDVTICQPQPGQSCTPLW